MNSAPLSYVIFPFNLKATRFSQCDEWLPGIQPNQNKRRMEKEALVFVCLFEKELLSHDDSAKIKQAAATLSVCSKKSTISCTSKYNMK